MTPEELNKACEFLETRLYPTVKVLNEDLVDVIDRWELIDEFRKAMGAVVKDSLTAVETVTICNGLTWHKTSDELPKADIWVMRKNARSPRVLKYYPSANRYFYDEYGYTEEGVREYYDYFMEIPELPKEN